jgi:hypothetical protein
MCEMLIRRQCTVQCQSDWWHWRCIDEIEGSHCVGLSAIEATFPFPEGCMHCPVHCPTSVVSFARCQFHSMDVACSVSDVDLSRRPHIPRSDFVNRRISAGNLMGDVLPGVNLTCRFFVLLWRRIALSFACSTCPLPFVYAGLLASKLPLPRQLRLCKAGATLFRVAVRGHKAWKTTLSNCIIAFDGVSGALLLWGSEPRVQGFFGSFWGRSL